MPNVVDDDDDDERRAQLYVTPLWFLTATKLAHHPRATLATLLANVNDGRRQELLLRRS